ncbi:MAG: VOC family protein [Ruminococcaceae bacterium]|nr:VOC family protein [Oscillospiraceae bacterium]
MFLEKQHHIAIISSDWDKAREFYIEKLGFELVREVWRPDQKDYLRLLRQGDTVLELFIRPEAPARVTNPEAMGLRHLAFHVADMEAAVAWLKDQGIETEPIREDKVNGGRFTFFRDPDDLPLELHE